MDTSKRSARFMKAYLIWNDAINHSNNHTKYSIIHNQTIILNHFSSTNISCKIKQTLFKITHKLPCDGLHLQVKRNSNSKHRSVSYHIQILIVKIYNLTPYCSAKWLLINSNCKERICSVNYIFTYSTFILKF